MKYCMHNQNLIICIVMLASKEVLRNEWKILVKRLLNMEIFRKGKGELKQK